MPRLEEMYRYFYLIPDKLTKLRRQPYFIFLALFMISGLVCLAALRHNNSTMLALRNDVYVADKNDVDVEGALEKLRAYVLGHMNTNLSTGTNIKPPIQLKYTYERLQKEAQAASSPKLYADAKDYCEKQIQANSNLLTSGQVACIQSYVLSHGGSGTNSIPVGLYEFDFVSPSWSPDLAGWSLVAAGFFALTSLVIFLLGKFTHPKTP